MVFVFLNAIVSIVKTTKRKGSKMKCDSCELMIINGIPCHEFSCPDGWKDEIRECVWCGAKFKPEEKRQIYCSIECSEIDN